MMTEEPSSHLNPNVSAGRKKKAAPVTELLAGIRAGHTGSLGQAITLVENTLPEARKQATELIRHCYPLSGRSLRIGITGIPGAGKSSLIEAIGGYFLDAGHKVAVLAVDPSSQVSKGSILGDKTRMETLALRNDVYIRPSPSGGNLGGVARTTRESIVLCEAAGYDVVLVETVGVGQSEITVHSMVDLFMLVAIPGAGDELQGVKRGIMEMADLIVINKAEGENRERARSSARQLENALHFFPAHLYGHTVEVMLCSALDGSGLPEVYAQLGRLEQELKTNGAFAARRRDQDLRWYREAVEEGLHQLLMEQEGAYALYADYEKQVAEGKMHSFDAAQLLLESYKQKLL